MALDEAWANSVITVITYIVGLGDFMNKTRAAEPCFVGNDM